MIMINVQRLQRFVGQSGELGMTWYGIRRLLKQMLLLQKLNNIFYNKIYPKEMFKRLRS